MRSRARPTGKYPSWKTGRMMQWESPNELNAFRLLDCIPEVTTFGEQPCEIVYLDENGEEASHFPDIEVRVSGCRELWEVKTESDAVRDPISTRTELLTRELPAHGFIYRIVTAEYLRRQPRLKSMCKLLDFGRRQVTEVEREYIRRKIVNRLVLVWRDACSGQYGPYGREILCRLVLEGCLKIDVESSIDAGTPFIPIPGRM